jgi:hypothetical protein
MSITIKQLGVPSQMPNQNGVWATVDHCGECLGAMVMGSEQQLRAAMGKELVVELGFLEIVRWRVIPTGTADQHGLRQAGSDTVRVTGCVHNILPTGEGASIYDIYIQRGPEFLSCESSELVGAPPSNGDCVELEVRGLCFYPTWP